MDKTLEIIDDFGRYIFKNKYINSLREEHEFKGTVGLSDKLKDYLDMGDIWEELGALKYEEEGMADGVILLRATYKAWKDALSEIFEHLL